MCQGGVQELEPGTRKELPGVEQGSLYIFHFSGPVLSIEDTLPLLSFLRNQNVEKPPLSLWHYHSWRG